MNILFFLIPKSEVAYIYEDETLRQAIEKMEHRKFSCIPIITRDGKYCGTIAEGDLLWASKDLCRMDLKQTEEHGIMEIKHRRDNAPVAVTTDIEDLLTKAVDQNFVPVIDDKGSFIGIITRRAIMRYCLDTYITPEEAAVK